MRSASLDKEVGEEVATEVTDVACLGSILVSGSLCWDSQTSVPIVSEDVIRGANLRAVR